jgi:hypothetical protein
MACGTKNHYSPSGRSYYCSNCKDQNKCKCEKSQKDKMMISLMSALLFLVIAHPETFKIMRKIFGAWVSTPTGCPSMNGLLFHAIVFFVVTWLLMNVNKREMDEGSETPPEEEVVEKEEEVVTIPEPVVVPEAAPSVVVNIPPPTVQPVSSMSGFDVSEDQVSAPILTGETIEPTMLGSSKFQGSYSECSCDNGGKVLILK